MSRAKGFFEWGSKGVKSDSLNYGPFLVFNVLYGGFSI